MYRCIPGMAAGWPESGIADVGVCPGPMACCSGCACTVTVCVQGCGGGTIAGAVVTLGSLASLITQAGGCTNTFCIDPLGGAGSYLLTVSMTGYYTYSETKSVTCGGTITVKLLPITGQPSAIFTVTGCCGQPLPGATVTIAGASYTTNSSGQVSLGITDAGTYPWSISKARFVTKTGSLTLTACSAGGTAVNATLVPASGFQCGPGNTSGSAFPHKLADPVPTTLFLMDSVYGAVTLTYSATPTPGWYGSLAVGTTPAICGCPGSGTTISYVLTQCPGGYSSSFPVHNIPFTSTACPTGPPGTSAASLPPGGETYTMNPTTPFNWSATYASVTCTNGIQIVGTFLIYPGGATITVTE